MLIRVNGGTNAGRRVIRPSAREPWTHRCDVPDTSRTTRIVATVTLDPTYTRCPCCGTRRP